MLLGSQAMAPKPATFPQKGPSVYITLRPEYVVGGRRAESGEWRVESGEVLGRQGDKNSQLQLMTGMRDQRQSVPSTLISRKPGTEYM